MKRIIPMWIAIIGGFAMMLSSFVPLAESAGEMFAVANT